MQILKDIAALSAILTSPPNPSLLSSVHDAQKSLSRLIEDSGGKNNIPPDVFTLSSQLLARSYTSVGRDDEAIEALLRCSLPYPPDDDDDVVMLLGLAYTRLQDYDEAIITFEKGQTPRCEYHALLTSLKAWEPLNDSGGDGGDAAAAAKGSALRWDATVNIEAPSIEALKELRDAQLNISPPASPPLPTPKTILHASLSSGLRSVPPSSSSILLRLASINALPCHGPFHLRVSRALDDKRGLHRLLKGAKFYPRGAIVRKGGSGVDASDLPHRRTDLVAKRPLSWGGYGVELWQNSTVEEVSKMRSPCDLVVQERVSDLMELRGGEFSLRLYVVCRDGRVYWSKRCLCKLAEEGGFITNSAFTGDARRQFEGFAALAKAVGGESELEKRISHVVNDTFARLGGLDLIPPAVAHIPKILGFDFLVRKDGELVLIEVNATPGLVARDDSGDEANVKKAVLEDAWDISSSKSLIQLTKR